MRKFGDYKNFETLIKIMDTLHGPRGCPWDRKQNVASLRKYFLEEAYETLDAADRADMDALKDELGDMLLEIVFLAKVAEKKGAFDIHDSIEAICKKLLRRHPHIFGKEAKKLEKMSAEDVFRRWTHLKMEEGGGKISVQLDKIPKNLPALLRAFRISERVSKIGFDWKSASDVWTQFLREIDEFKKAAKSKSTKKIEDEFGDLLFTLANVGRHYGICAEDALRASTEKFKRRFKKLEEIALKKGLNISELPLEKLDELWEEAKKKLKKPKIICDGKKVK